MQSLEVYEAIVSLLIDAGFMRTSNGGCYHGSKLCFFQFHDLVQYKTVVDFQLDYPFYGPDVQ